MDGRTRYKRISEMLKEFKDQQLNQDNLRQLIMINVGCDERTISSSFKTMIDTHLIEDIGNCKFRIN